MQAARSIAAAAAPPPRRHNPATPQPRGRPAASSTRLRAIPDPSSSSSSGDGAGDGEVVASTRQRRGAGAAAPPAGGSLKQEAVQSNREVSDKLIDVFQQKKPAEWRKLIAYSRQWPVLAQGVFDRRGGRCAEGDAVVCPACAGGLRAYWSSASGLPATSRCCELPQRAAGRQRHAC